MENFLRFYGTSAAEGIPDPFCACSVCRNARAVGGKEIRRRTMLRVDEQTSIDLGADALQQAIEYGDMVSLRHVLVTHTHEDHLNLMMPNIRDYAYERREGPLHFYLTDKAYGIADYWKESEVILKGRMRLLEETGVIAFHRLCFGEEAKVGGLTVLPLRGNHWGSMGENSANYLVRLPDGRRFYYGLDTGWYLEETIEALRGAKLDWFVSECTFGLVTGRGEHPDSHLDAFSLERLIWLLYEQETLRPDTQIVLTHISHRTSHASLVEHFMRVSLPCPLTVAWDGMSFAHLGKETAENS